jgi:hypothetical protein
MYERIERPLNAAEIRMLRSSIGRARRDSRISPQLRRLLGLTPPIVIVATLFSWFFGHPLSMGALSGVAFVAIMAPLVVLRNRRTQERIITGHSNALAIDRAIVHSVQASYCVKFEEREDEGDLWMFQVGPDEVLALQGQVYYETPRFPALNFEIVEIPSLPVLIRTRSAKVSPDETVRAPVSGFLPSIEGIGIRSLKGDAHDCTGALQSLRG